ncbi:MULTISPECIES: hypothetical protein [Bacillus cereus group]|uniref:hypothetical protein n=1 Tax=Bacillus cereus group TaxID=86661 RepID=UPI0018CE413E|nr:MULTISPECIES: hypothetical protein [Bacillus cereus group]MBG9837922.1 hypothetical protein [Bacillus tropicus]MBG9880153.1 hypothetical protein [Bacillus tropicus]MBG9923401.1 hypothetical protein [Bacillus tropicus]MBJ8355325.1 hypothetical protein [Bacillus mycoides]MED2903909.1 hypothetical protein [Bacillus tropicus]
MIVNKPQFDTETIKSGTAYWLSKYNYSRRTEISTPCIVKFVKPLSIVVGFYDEKQKSFTELTIDIKSIVDGTFELTPMVRKVDME